MFGSLIVCYLFLGGAGAGACLASAVLGLLAPRERVAVLLPRRFGASPRAVLRAPAPYRRFVGAGFAVALVVLLLGVACLAADVGRADRIVLLLTSPTASFVAVGAWALGACALLAAALALAWGGLASWGDGAVRVLEALAVVCAPVVMAYTGLLLQSLSAVPLWASPWLPVLFVLSSCSCGIALVLGAAQLSGAAGAFSAVVRRLAAADAAVIVLEVLAAAAYLGFSWADSAAGATASGTGMAAAASVQALATGSHAGLFWGGFVLAGLAVPLVLDMVLAHARRNLPAAALAAAACVLAGGFVLRWCLVEAGMQPMLVMVGL